jgi:hypothetical protein
MEDFTRQLDPMTIEQWQIDKSYEGEIQIEFYNKSHCVANYSVVVNSSLEFTIFVFSWPVPDHHLIYNEQKRSINYLDVHELVANNRKFQILPGTDRGRRYYVCGY